MLHSFMTNFTGKPSSFITARIASTLLPAGSPRSLRNSKGGLSQSHTITTGRLALYFSDNGCATTVNSEQ